VIGQLVGVPDQLSLERGQGRGQVAPTAQAAARARTLGFPDLKAYLMNRYVTRRWPQRLIAAEIDLHPDWLRALVRTALLRLGVMRPPRRGASRPDADPYRSS